MSDDTEATTTNGDNGDISEKLEIYKILYQAYADEIKNLWTRSVFLGAFMTLAWGGYGALQLKMLDKDFTISLAYCAMSLGLCGVIAILSLLWIAMAKGSKFIQRAHERHIELYGRKYGCRLYCKLKEQENALQNELDNSLLRCGCLKAYRYSPSKINIFLGWFSCVVSIFLLLIHIVWCAYAVVCNLIDIKTTCAIIVVAIIVFLLILLFVCYQCCNFKKKLKGGN